MGIVGLFTGPVVMAMLVATCPEWLHDLKLSQTGPEHCTADVKCWTPLITSQYDPAQPSSSWNHSWTLTLR